jgi:hypothetical protein
MFRFRIFQDIRMAQVHMALVPVSKNIKKHQKHYIIAWIAWFRDV